METEATSSGIANFANAELLENDVVELVVADTLAMQDEFVRRMNNPKRGTVDISFDLCEPNSIKTPGSCLD